ncbi:SMI1/KNR4 family protein [Metabacillus fastidiosus]|uniref:SMI1/KNR4 family protein n=1 Tax=Metabacillus fastidiosus TaxID=1458 RepID=UPI000826264C|nr:SMI1/KNR4 family protein [Metabacillus fastidiosus]MED4462282.1 SMI1/KNR4 family protein [Metabacillus fastidiosus]
MRKQIVELTDIPQDYTDFLKEVGYGSVGNAYFMFYEGLIEAEEIFDTEENEELNNVLLLGDNLSGDAVGFLTTDNWSIVEVWHEDLSIVLRKEKTFKQFVRNVFLKEM